MKKIIAGILAAFVMAAATVHTKAEPIAYAMPIIAGIADDYSYSEKDLSGFAFCAYDDISIAYHWKDEKCPFEKAFLMSKFQIPSDGIIYAIELKDQFIVLTDFYGTVISVQNMTKNQERAQLLASFASTFDLNKLSKSDLEAYKALTYDLLYQTMALQLIWFDATMYSDGDQYSSVKNVWH